MKKITLIDGNNLLFRSYYATAYTGNIMKNSKDFPTNALYGFVGMINKIMNEEKPEYVAVAFDVGKNFRSEKHSFYKEGRKKTPDELVMQMPYARTILTAMGIPYFELEPYEADDIIGTFAKLVEIDEDFIGTIVSSDKDLLQLVSEELDMKLLKQHDFISYTENSFKEEYGLDPIKMIDIKSLAGDSSDNIPGVKGIGEKTAITLLQKYGSLEGIYENIDYITGKTKEKLVADKEMAFVSKEIATIYRDVPLDVKDLEDLYFKGQDTEKLVEIYEELEFKSYLKNINTTKVEVSSNYKIIENINEIELEDTIALYVEIDNNNYHQANILGISLVTSANAYFIKVDLFNNLINLIRDKKILTFDAKKLYVLMARLGLENITVEYDLMIAAYLLELSFKDDISEVMLHDNYQVTTYDAHKKAKFVDLKTLESEMVLKAKYIFDTYEKYINLLDSDLMLPLFSHIEMPLTTVLADMEFTGIPVDKSVLEELKIIYKEKIETISKVIYELAGMEFNISSPKQLGEVLFDKMALPYAKKGQTGYKTDVKILHKLLDVHPIASKILEYRNATKLYSTYLEGLENYILEDGKIHTIYKQNLTRTGRLSSVEPNLQNIPTRDDDGKRVRKAFLPSNDLLISADYSQIELRILAHISDAKEMIQAFVDGEDIHRKVAADIHGVDLSEVSSKMRSTAKAVIFGIVYGISGFGLGENLEISPKEAKMFIDKYFELYPSVKHYMDSIIKTAHKTGYVRTLFNRKRTIDELKSSNFMIRQGGERIALNTPIQGTSADIIKKAMVDIHREMKSRNLKSKMILQVHDELIFDCVIEEKKELEDLVNEIMTSTITLSVPLKIGIESGANWYDAK